MAVCNDIYDVYINLVIMVYVLHTSQLVQCGEVLLQWSLLQSRKFFHLTVTASVTYQRNTSYETDLFQLKSVISFKFDGRHVFLSETFDLCYI